MKIDLCSFQKRSEVEKGYQEMFSQLRQHAIQVTDVVGNPGMICLRLSVDLPEAKSNELLGQ